MNTKKINTLQRLISVLYTQGKNYLIIQFDMKDNVDYYEVKPVKYFKTFTYSRLKEYFEREDNVAFYVTDTKPSRNYYYLERKMKIEIIQFNENLIMPTYANDGDAGLDCYSLEDVTIDPQDTKLIDLGFGLNLPYGYMATLRPRSSMNKKGLITQIGTIDSGYRGQIKATFVNPTTRKIHINKCDKIVQLIVQPIEKVELYKNTRGNQGFGSTGR